MQTIKLKKDIEHEGLVAGDVLSVDDDSAAALVRRGDAEPYEPDAPAASAARDTEHEVKPTTYGAQDGVRTIDDIRDPQAARNRRVMSFTTVAAPDPGPVAATVDEAEQGDPAEPESDPEPAKASTAARGGRGGRNALNVPTSTSTEQAAPDAQSAGGDAGGGNS